MKKFLVLPAFASVLLLAACNQQSDASILLDSSSSSDSGQQMSDPVATDPTGAGDPSDADPSAADPATSSPSADAPSADARVIEIAVDNWSFTPNAINVKKGENVVLRLKGVAGIHAFASKDLGINIAINPDETKDVPLPTDAAGTFNFRCMIPCGEGHRDMTGVIVIS
jgi:cytochrome c oxidase subunit 2